MFGAQYLINLQPGIINIFVPRRNIKTNTKLNEDKREKVKKSSKFENKNFEDLG